MGPEQEREGVREREPLLIPRLQWQEGKEGRKEGPNLFSLRFFAALFEGKERSKEGALLRRCRSQFSLSANCLVCVRACVRRSLFPTAKAAWAASRENWTLDAIGKWTDVQRNLRCHSFILFYES